MFALGQRARWKVWLLGALLLVALGWTQLACTATAGNDVHAVAGVEHFADGHEHPQLPHLDSCVPPLAAAHALLPAQPAPQDAPADPYSLRATALLACIHSASDRSATRLRSPNLALPTNTVPVFLASRRIRL